MATASTAVPKKRRPNVTWNGAYAPVPTLMRRKLKPQTPESTAKRMRQSTARRRGGVTGAAPGVVRASVVFGGRSETAGATAAEALSGPVVAVLMGSTMTCPTY